jgi:hypothetical protein
MREALTSAEKSRIVNDIGSLIINNGLSYNQASEIFSIVLERLRDVPFFTQKNQENKE